MNESFQPSLPKIEQTVSQEAFAANSFRERLNKCKEYLKTVPENLKKTGLITVIFSMGIFNIAEAQNQDSNLNKTVDDLVSKKISIEAAADLIYQHVEKDKTFSYVEYNQSQNGQQSNTDVKVSGPEIIPLSVGDTVSIGDFEAKEYSVMVSENLESSGNTVFKQESRFISGIKPYSGQAEKKLKQKEISYKSFGKSKEQAVISAVAGLAGLENTEVSVMSQSINEQASIGGKESFKSDFIELSISETKPTILNNVRVVVLSTPDGFSAEAFCN